MRLFEVLCAALFTLDATGSGLAVAVVSAARTMPMLLLGAFAGVMSEAVDRKRILLIGQIMSGLVPRRSPCSPRSAWRGRGTSGSPRCSPASVWSTEMSTRRRMVGECVEGALVPRALALDTVTNSITRLVGPIAAGASIRHWARRRLRDVRLRLCWWRSSWSRGLRLPADSRRIVLSAGAARPRRGIRVRPRPRDHRRRARGHHRDEPAGVSATPRWSRRSRGRCSWCRRR